MSRRLQLALNVNDIGEAVTFYSRLFGTEPAKVRPGYANFAIAEPPLKLVLLENPGQGGSLNHLGVEVPDTDTVEAEQARLAGTGLASAGERDTTCCYARQDKFWVQGAPDGESWEIYTVLADSPTFYGEGHGAQCCGGPGGHTGQPASAAGPVLLGTCWRLRTGPGGWPPGPFLIRLQLAAAAGPVTWLALRAARPCALAQRGRASSRPRCRGVRSR